MNLRFSRMMNPVASGNLAGIGRVVIHGWVTFVIIEFEVITTNVSEGYSIEGGHTEKDCSYFGVREFAGLSDVVGRVRSCVRSKVGGVGGKGFEGFSTAER